MKVKCGSRAGAELLAGPGGTLPTSSPVRSQQAPEPPIAVQCATRWPLTRNMEPADMSSGLVDGSDLRRGLPHWGPVGGCLDSKLWNAGFHESACPHRKRQRPARKDLRCSAVDRTLTNGLKQEHWTAHPSNARRMRDDVVRLAQPPHGHPGVLGVLTPAHSCPPRRPCTVTVTAVSTLYTAVGGGRCTSVVALGSVAAAQCALAKASAVSKSRRRCGRRAHRS
jgi:hypothetical protein